MKSKASEEAKLKKNKGSSSTLCLKQFKNRKPFKAINADFFTMHIAFSLLRFVKTFAR